MALPAPHSAATPAHGTTTLLVVADDDTIGVPLVEGLELEGFETTRVRPRRRRRRRRDTADFVLLDLGLPDVVKPFGFRELVARIRAVQRRRT